MLWQKVMSRIHEGLEDKNFFNSGELVQVTVCQDSGMLATTACEADPRGSRVTTEYCAADNAPTEYCTMHTGGGMLNYSRAHFYDYPDLVAIDDEYVTNSGYITADGSTVELEPDTGISGAVEGQPEGGSPYIQPEGEPDEDALEELRKQLFGNGG